MIKDNVAETVKAIAEFIAARGIPGMTECRDYENEVHLSREWRTGSDPRSFSVYLFIDCVRGDRFESDGAVYRPLRVRASVTTTGSSMSATEALAYGNLLSAVATLAADLEYTFDAPVYECLATAEDNEARKQKDISNERAAIALAHVQETGKGMRVGNVRFTKTQLPEGAYIVEHNGKTYRVTSRAIPGEYNCEVERTA